MLGVFIADVFYAKIIHEEAETDWAPVMLPEYRGDGALKIPLCILLLFKELLGQDAGVR